MTKRQRSADTHYGEFVWGNRKAADNIINHNGLTFEEAVTIWNDPFIIETDDPDHSWDEHRFLAFGMSQSLKILVVSFTDREGLTRIISARELEPSERKQYENAKQEN